MNELTKKIGEADLGLISAMARFAQRTNQCEAYVLEVYEQLTVHDPEFTRKKLGDELADEVLRAVEER